MPAIKVEYAKSGRARCTLKECGKFIEKGEVRIGTGAMMPGADELSYKWRHLCCFTKRQLVAVPSVDTVEGFDDLAEVDQQLILRLVKGELVGDTSVLGRVAPSQRHLVDASAKATTAKKKKKKMAITSESVPPLGSSSPAALPVAAGAAAGAGSDTDATEDFDDVVASTVAAAPRRARCEFGSKCFRKNPEHFKTHSHPGEPDYDTTDVGSGSPAPVVSSEPPAAPAAADGLEQKRPRGEGRAVQTTLPQLWGIASPSGSSTMPAPAAEAAGGGGTATIRYTAKGQKICPFGPMCFRTAKEHFIEWAHE